VPEVTLKSLFENERGLAHISELQSLSSSALNRFTDITADDLELLNNPMLERIDKLLDEDELLEDVKVADSSVLAGHKEFRNAVCIHLRFVSFPYEMADIKNFYYCLLLGIIVRGNGCKSVNTITTIAYLH